jgi:antitoxin component HigA of HigAB toxin-antitoxin module
MNGYRPKGPTRWGERKPTPAAKPLQQTPLGEDCFQSLLTQVNAFFAEAERDKVAERAAAITEIQALMAQYGLSTEDLLD